jgi:Cu-Zn family superoxide dismutase
LFFNVKNGVMVCAEISGLPQKTNVCESPVFALHIHSGNSCTGDYKDPFSDAGVHFNPENCIHPFHAGDLPPLFGVKGKAVMCVLTDHFKLKDVIGRAVIIHKNPDDFTTQPSGNAGEKIACGIIKAY